MEESPARTQGQLAWVFDLNKCMGCPTCEVACHDLWTSDGDMDEQWWLTTTTEPGEGHPRGWREMGGGYDEDGNLVLGDVPPEHTIHDQIRMDYGKPPQEGTEEVPVESKPEWTFNWEEDQGGGEHPNSWHFYLPKLCMQCTRAPCVEACPEDAIVKRDEDGLVIIDEESCDGNEYCRRACPYKVIWFNEDRGTAEQPGVSQMCMGCVPRIENEVAPACARSCPARAVHFGFLDNRDGSVHKLVRSWNVALPLHPEYNTGPNVYYVPPLSSSKLDEEGRYTNEERIPLDYLEFLFGSEVGSALETLKKERSKKRNGEESELMDLLIGWEWPEDFFGEFTRHPDEMISQGEK